MLEARFLWIKGLFCFVLMAAPLVLGQSANQGAIVGSVVDPGGGVVPGVTILVRNVTTNLERTTISDDRGNYRIEFLQPGEYEVTGELAGFKKVHLSGVLVRVGQVVRADIELHIGEVADTVTVEGATTTVKTESATLGGVVDNVMIQNLPLNGREFYQLAATVAGAHAGLAKRGAVAVKGSSPTGGEGFTLGFSGARSSQNSYSVDGIDSTDADRNELISSPPLDAIKEFSVESNLYAAQHGRAGGGVISVTTQSGTNEFHGSLYEYHRNKALDARPYFFRGTREEQPMYLFNQFGGSLGGPILKNKTFFFVAAEFFRQKKPGQNMISFAPTAAERAGDFSSSLDGQGQPLTLLNPYTQEPIAGNVLPAGLQHPVGSRLLELWAQPNFDHPITNLRFMRSGTSDIDKWTTRVDHSFDENNTLSGTFNFGDYDNILLGTTEFADGNSLAHDRALGLTYTRVFSPSLVNDTKFGYVTYNHGLVGANTDKNYADEWGIWNDSDNTGVPRLSMFTTGFAVYNLAAVVANEFKNKNIYFKNSLIWNKGNHTLHFGGDFKRQDYNWRLVNSDIGVISFGYGPYEAHPSLHQWYGATGNVIATLMTGLPAYMLKDYRPEQFQELRRNMFAFWFQDDWRVHPRLTLMLGLRYDFLAPFEEINGRIARLNHATGKLSYGSVDPSEVEIMKFDFDVGGPNTVYDPSKRDFAPRIGLAYRPFDDNRTAFRAGYGLFYANEAGRYTSWGAWLPPFKGTYNWAPQPAWWPDGQARWTTYDQKPRDIEERIGAPPTWSVFTTQDYPTAYFQQWNVSLEREVINRLSVELAYVGSKGTNLSGLTPVPEDLQARILQFAPVFPNLMGKGFNSKYNSLQVTVRKDLSHGLNFRSAFTWGHAMAEASNEETAENIFKDTGIDGEVIHRRYSRADFDVRKRFVFTGGWELPFGRGRSVGQNWSSWVNSILGGWQTFGVLTLSDGFPYTVYDPAFRLPNRICDGNLPASQRTVERWFDHSCFVTNSPTPVVGPDGVERLVNWNGDAGSNIITSPGIGNVDLGIHKNFAVTEAVTAQFRFETFNAFNRPNLIGPNQTFFNQDWGAEITRARDNRSIQLALKVLF